MNNTTNRPNAKPKRNADLKRDYEAECLTCGKRYYYLKDLSKKYNISTGRILELIRNNPPKV